MADPASRANGGLVEYRDHGDSGAILSFCQRYRYALWRKWDPALPAMAWVMLNPSTADERSDDPTIRKCIGFAKRMNYGGIIVVNLFAWRATNPAQLPQVPEPVGPDNDTSIASAIAYDFVGAVVCGWGRPAHRRVAVRALAVARILRAGRVSPTCLHATKDGHPGHPLYLPYTSELIALPGGPR